MDAAAQLIVANLLNGVSPETVARTFGGTEAEVRDTFGAAMKLVAEYRFVHCMPHFDSSTLDEARQNKLRVLDILQRVARWDEIERDVMLDLLKGKDVSGYGLTQRELEGVLKRTLDALPNYLQKGELQAYYQDRRAFVAARKARVIEAVEKFISFENPLTYKSIDKVGIDLNNVEDVDRQMAGALL